jgi:predicted PurR-regulated permease PerM
MAIVNPVPGAIVRLVLLVAIVGIILGVTLSGIEMLNPKMSAAKQQQISEQTRHRAALNAIEEQKATEEHRLEMERLRRRLEIELAIREVSGYALTIAGALALVILSVGVTVFLARYSRRWSGLSGAMDEDKWKSKAYRDARIQIARENELRHRRAMLAGERNGDDGHWTGRICLDELVPEFSEAGQ